jgi:hypothetical protein
MVPGAQHSPSASARAGRVATSFTDTIAATWLQTGTPWGGSQEVVQRAAFVGLEVRKARSAALEGHHFADCLGDERNIRFGPVWKMSGSSSSTKVLVEVEANPARDLDRCVDAVDAGRDLVEVGAARGLVIMVSPG